MKWEWVKYFRASDGIGQMLAKRDDGEYIYVIGDNNRATRSRLDAYLGKPRVSEITVVQEAAYPNL